MQCECSRTSGVDYFKLTGHMNYNDHDFFRKAVMVELLNGERGSKAVFDLSALETIDSAGIGMIIIADDEARQHDISLNIYNPTGVVRRILELAKLEKHMAITYPPD